MGVYEYGKGGKACFHSCIHPVGAEHSPVGVHPGILEVTAKRQCYAMADAEFTLSELPEPGPGFEQTDRPGNRGNRELLSVLNAEKRDMSHETARGARKWMKTTIGNMSRNWKGFNRAR